MFEASKDYSKARGKPKYDAGWQSDSTYGAADVVWCSQCVCALCLFPSLPPPFCAFIPIHSHTNLLLSLLFCLVAKMCLVCVCLYNHRRREAKEGG